MTQRCLLKMRSELPSAHSISARIQQRRPRFSVGPLAVDAEAREHDAIPRDKHGDGFCRRDIRIEFKIHPRPAVKLTRDPGPFTDRSKTVAHQLKMAILKGGSSARVLNEPDTRLTAIPTIESAMVAVASQPSQ